MDERDQEWLDKNNEEARGEGTSAQGAVSNAGARSSRSTKKGKEPEGNHPIAISEDDFELVMSIFEKVTHEKTEFLHHVSTAIPVYSAIYLTSRVNRASSPGRFSLLSLTIKIHSHCRCSHPSSLCLLFPHGSRNRLNF